MCTIPVSPHVEKFSHCKDKECLAISIWLWFTVILQLYSLFLFYPHLKGKLDRNKVIVDKIRNVYQSLFGSCLILHLSSVFKFFSVIRRLIEMVFSDLANIP